MAAGEGAWSGTGFLALLDRVFLERLPTGEAFLEAVPVPDLRLAEAPAQEDLLSTPPG